MTLPGLARLSEAAAVVFFDPFALHARLDFDFNDRESYPINFPILIHEYTHYLQSVSTIYGLYRVLDWIRTGVRLVSVLPSLPEVRIPLLRWWTSRDCPDALRAQMADIAVRLALTDDLEQPESLARPVVETLGPLQLARVKFSDGEPHIMAVVPASGDVAIPIGARALAEGMSASVQRIWETEPRVGAVLAALDPKDAGWYTATRTLLSEVVGSEEDLDFVNAFVCDAAMMTRNPPAAFIAAVVAIIEADARSKDSVVVAVREALHEMIDEEIAGTRKDIAGILGRLGASDEPFAQAVRRLLTTSDELLGRRSEEIGFPLDVVFGQKLAEVQSLLQRYPLPIYFEGTTFRSWHGEEVLERLGEEFLMMEHVMRILLYGPQSGTACPLTGSSSCQATKSILCDVAPWRINLNAEGMTCAFGSALSTFGVLGKVIV